MLRIPRDKSAESSLALLREGYTFISSRCDRYQSDIFQARLLLQNTLCMRGEAAARLFYDGERFQREGAIPMMLQKTLLGQGSVMALDGEAHRVRKGLFMSLMGAENIAELARLTTEGWQAAIGEWQKRDSVVLFHAVQEIHCRAVCQWAGVPLKPAECAERCADLVALVDGAGGVGKRHWQARQARSRLEDWIGELVREVRTNTRMTNEDRALFRVSWHRDLDGQLLETRTAAVEVLNLLRPTVAIARFVAFTALALHENPQWRERLASDDALIEPFIQEVRRFYGFFPFTVARVRQDFDWQGYRFIRGTRVLLDLYGTNHDPRSWQMPELFRPERFQEDGANAYNFIPQGGDDYATQHRCPGEWFTLELMRVAVRQLTRVMTYEVPAQNLDIDWTRIPLIPESRFVIRQVRPLEMAEKSGAMKI